MRVLFTSFPGNTHYFNSVSLAWAMSAAGHEVRVASGPELTDTITRSGLVAVPVGSAETLKEKTARVMRERNHTSMGQWAATVGAPQDRMAEGRGDFFTWEHLSRLVEVVLAPAAHIMNDSLFDDLVAFSRWWRPDLVVWDAMSYAGSVAAAATGAPHARMLYSHDTDGWTRRHFLRMKALQPPDAQEDLLQEWLTGWAEKFDVDFSEDLLNGHVTIDQLPDSFRLDTGLRYLSMRYVPYNGPASVPKWLWSEPPAPRVLMAFGLSARAWDHLQVLSIGQVQQTLDAMADMDIELVLALPPDLREKLTRVPDNTRIVDFVPFQAILPSCSVVIHQGGPGSFNSPLLFGVPQLLISITPDVVQKNQHLRAAKAGLAIARAEATAAKIREAVQELLTDPAYRAGAAGVRREILGQPTPSDVVGELERLVAAHRDARGR